jgi:hypothetical protein
MRPYSKGQKNHARRIIENDNTPIVAGAWPTSQSPGDARCSSWLAKHYLKILVPPRLTFSRFDHKYSVALVIAIQGNFNLLF